MKLHMLDAMKQHETQWKLREKLGRYEKLCMIKMVNFGTLKMWKQCNFEIRVIFEM